jgi:hypothetical protein
MGGPERAHRYIHRAMNRTVVGRVVRAGQAV